MKGKKILSLILSVSLVLTLVLATGCGAEKETEKKEKTKAKTGTEFTKLSDKLDEQLKPLPEKNQDIEFGLILSSLGNEFWQTLGDGAKAAAKEYGVKLDIQATDDDSDFTGQLDILETMISKKYGAVAVSPLSENNLISGVKKANKNDVKIILNGTALNKDAMKTAKAHIDGQLTMDFYKQGTMAGEFAAKKCDNKGEVAIIAGVEGATQADGRRDGAKEAFKKHGMKVVAVQQCDFDQQKAYDATKTIMQANPEIKAITCGNDDMAMGVIKALKELDKNDDVVVVGNDFTTQARDAIKKGDLDASVAQSPYLRGKAVLITMIKASNGEKIGNVDLAATMILVDKDNVAKMEDWK